MPVRTAVTICWGRPSAQSPASRTAPRGIAATVEPLRAIIVEHLDDRGSVCRADPSRSPEVVDDTNQILEAITGELMLRIVKILLILAVVAWALVGVLGNALDWEGTTNAVAAVTSMSKFAGGADHWNATTNPAIVTAGASFILLFKVVVVAFCSAGAWRMWIARNDDGEAFEVAKMPALAGCGIAVLSLFGGWVVIGEGWFEFWRSDALREAAGGTAFRYGGFISLIALLVGSRDEWAPRPLCWRRSETAAPVSSDANM